MAEQQQEAVKPQLPNTNSQFSDGGNIVAESLSMNPQPRFQSQQQQQQGQPLQQPQVIPQQQLVQQQHPNQAVQLQGVQVIYQQPMVMQQVQQGPRKFDDSLIKLQQVIVKFKTNMELFFWFLSLSAIISIFYTFIFFIDGNTFLGFIMLLYFADFLIFGLGFRQALKSYKEYQFVFLSKLIQHIKISVLPFICAGICQLIYDIHNSESTMDYISSFIVILIYYGCFGYIKLRFIQFTKQFMIEINKAEQEFPACNESGPTDNSLSACLEKVQYY